MGKWDDPEYSEEMARKENELRDLRDKFFPLLDELKNTKTSGMTVAQVFEACTLMDQGRSGTDFRFYENFVDGDICKLKRLLCWVERLFTELKKS